MELSTIVARLCMTQKGKVRGQSRNSGNGRRCGWLLYLLAGITLAWISAASIAEGACTPQPSGLVNWWRAENNGTDFLGANNGTLVGVSFAPGEVGSAFSFDGGDDYVLIGASPISVPWTAEFWVNRQPGVEDSAVLLSDTNTALKLEQYPNLKKVGFTEWFVGGLDYSFNYTAPVGVWTHLVFVGMTDNTTQLYVNGALQDSVPHSIPLPRMIMGQDITNRYDKPLNGLLDEISLYNRALSPAEIQALYNAGSAGKCVPPGNDNFANAFEIFGSASGSNVAASKEPGEPNHANNPGGASVWWQWTAPGDGQINIDTFGSSFDTLLAMYTGNSVSSLTLIASDSKDFDGNPQASLSRENVSAGTTYYFAVDGYNSGLGPEEGSITLNLSFCVPPKVDDVYVASETSQADGIHVLFCANVEGSQPLTYDWQVGFGSPPVLSTSDPSGQCFEVVVDPTNETTLTVTLSLQNDCGFGQNGTGVTTCGICLSRGISSLLTGTTGSGGGPVLTNKNCGVLSSSARWYKLICTNGSGTVALSAGGSSTVTQLAVYTGPQYPPGQLALVVCSAGNQINFDATAFTPYWVAVDAGNSSSGLQLDVGLAPFPLTVTGLSANNKVYDGTTAATISGTPQLSGLGSSSVSLSGTATGTFADKHVGNNKPVSVSGLSLSGGAPGDYSLSLPALSAKITPATLGVTGLTANSKVYDGTTAAIISGTAALTGVVGSDSVSLSGTVTGSFADKHVGNNKPVSLSGLSLGGGAASDYNLGLPTLSASITPASLGVSGLTANNKVYDGTTAATIVGTATLTGVLGNDSVSLSGTVTGIFGDKNVGNNKPVSLGGVSLGGGAASDYSLSLPTLSANISSASLGISGLTANNKVYDGTRGATISGTATLTGVLGSDSVSLNGTVTGTFADQNVGNNKPVSLSGLSLGGGDSGDYSLGLPTLSANITSASLGVSGLTANNKVYDGTRGATISGTATLTGVLGSDSVSLNGTVTGAFADQNVGNNKPVTLGGLTLGGGAASDYSLGLPTLSASITPASLGVSGLTANDKVYDATRSATISGTAALTGVLGSDSLSLNGTVTGTFVDQNVGNNKPVTLGGLSLGGGAATDYSLGLPTLSASIIPASLGVSGLTANDKVYDATRSATISGTAALTGVLGSDSLSLNGTVTGTFVDKNVGNNKPVTLGGLSLGGGAAADYSLGLPTLSANITPLSLGVSGLTANNKVYDGTPVAAIVGTATLTGVLGSDSVSLSGVAVGTFASKNVGNNIVVSISGLQLQGSAAGDYILVEPTTLANILPPTLTIGSPIFNSPVLSVSIDTAAGATYTLEYKSSLSDPNWAQSDSVVGDGTTKVLADGSARSGSRFYRIHIQVP